MVDAASELHLAVALHQLVRDFRHFDLHGRGHFFDLGHQGVPWRSPAEGRGGLRSSDLGGGSRGHLVDVFALECGPAASHRSLRRVCHQRRGRHRPVQDVEQHARGRLRQDGRGGHRRQACGRRFRLVVWVLGRWLGAGRHLLHHFPRHGLGRLQVLGCVVRVLLVLLHVQCDREHSGDVWNHRGVVCGHGDGRLLHAAHVFRGHHVHIFLVKADVVHRRHPRFLFRGHCRRVR
mmetsp:Transcript_104358/g.319488  ORF Transcript_104358/g.319488 Transcript_104358/m.319488 type:complete len:234 (+) Transcript_104358:399-1100(+)